ncbi:DUF3455 domain-containing protein [Paraburkholderia azotifigens]|uniref:DUF3455 domain-containing protein n=1 Tax=Paraburkholderia azotifigens TaxID=2057004 RepID=A0A5C6VDK9_9BURK|nr:DUF3455 domain-containing protein [Paraburkholderia azotifigens]
MFPFRFCPISAIGSLCADGPRRPAARAAVLVCVALILPVAANAADPVPPTLSPADVQPFAVTTATGVQIYRCEFDSSRHLRWVFQHPKATLYDAAGQAAIQHDAGPSWEAADGSRIVGRVLAQAPSASPNSIPQLLLETHTTAQGSLSAVRFVQRLDTAGGTAPAESCVDEHQTGSSPYFARYIFLK